MSRKFSQECSCWVPYPNKNHMSNRKCKCDNYINIDNVDYPRRKTHCIRKDVIFGFIKEGNDK